MAGAVHVSIVTLLGLILHVRGVDRDATGLLFGRLVDLVIAHCLSAANLRQRVMAAVRVVLPWST